MHEHDSEPLDQNLLEEMGYEKKDVDFSTLSRSIVGFMVVTTVLMFFGLFMMWVVIPQATFKAPPEKVAERKAIPQAPVPLIQGNVSAQADFRDFVKEERRSLTTYAWTDRKNGFVRVPVDEAMKSVLAQGLPSRPGATMPKEDGP